MTVRHLDDLDACRVLLLPGWQNSGPGHWQTRWEALHGDVRVEQDDWMWPRRGDWMACLEEAVCAPDPRPVLLAAHSLGCHLVSAWAGHSQHTAHARGALLVAPPDLDRDDLPPQLANWRSAVRRPLPFAATVVGSDDDPYAAVDRTAAMASAWGARCLSAGPRGHLNAASGLGDWPEARAWLAALAVAR